MGTLTRAVGQAHARLDGPDKVRGAARYSVEYPVENVAYAWPVPSTVVKGRITRVDTRAALAEPGVLAVLSYENAPRLTPAGDPELFVLQEPAVAYRGQIVALAVAGSLEAAREAAGLVRLEYDTWPHDTVLTENHPGLYQPSHVNPSLPTDTEIGNFDAGYAAAPVRVDATYRTPAEHNNPMEPHASTVQWQGDRLVVHDANQGPGQVQAGLATLFGLPPERVRVITEHVGGGFGCKTMRCCVVLAALAARHVDRPVRLALTRQQMFGVVGYRTPTIQRIRLGADPTGRLTASCHDAISQSSMLKEFAEQTAVYGRPLYAAPHRRTTHRLARLDVPSPAWMRAPGQCPGSFAVESAMDELAVTCGVDPVELRIRNEPATDPEEGTPYSSRNLVACLREGAHRFGWADRDRTPAVRRAGRCLLGTGVAGSIYPARSLVSSASAYAGPDGAFLVQINAVDIGTGARTALWQIAADELGVPPDRVMIRVGDTGLPEASLAGGSTGTASWGWAVAKVCREIRVQIDDVHGGSVPAGGVHAQVDTTADIQAQQTFSRYAFGAQFAEVRVDVDTGEVRVDRLLGVFAAGRIVNALTARSQLIGGMTMGMSMALLEEGLWDPRSGDWANHDLATYHVAGCADIEQIEAYWLDEDDPHLNPAGVKGIGEIGIVGTAAAITNAVYHATGVRVRDLPVRLDRLLGHRA